MTTCLNLLLGVRFILVRSLVKCCSGVLESKFLYQQSPKMSDFLISTDFEANRPWSPVALGQWLLKNGVPDEIVHVVKGKFTCLGVRSIWEQSRSQSSSCTRSVSFWLMRKHFLQLMLLYSITIYFFFFTHFKFSAQCCVKMHSRACTITMLIYALLLAGKSYILKHCFCIVHRSFQTDVYISWLFIVVIYYLRENIDGPNLRTLTDRDLKISYLLSLSFLERKKT